MTTDANLLEIRDKIYRLKTAIMYSMSNDVCKLPNSIVTAVRVDDEGQLWFACPKPLHEVAEYAENFPVRLHFYHKGVFFHLEISGKACIVDDDYHYDGAAGLPIGGKQMLVRMTMNTIEYTEPYGRKERSRLEMLMEKGYNWLLRNVSVSRSTEPVLSKNAMLL